MTLSFFYPFTFNVCFYICIASLTENWSFILAFFPAAPLPHNSSDNLWLLSGAFSSLIGGDPTHHLEIPREVAPSHSVCLPLLTTSAHLVNKPVWVFPTSWTQPARKVSESPVRSLSSHLMRHYCASTLWWPQVWHSHEGRRLTLDNLHSCSIFLTENCSLYSFKSLFRFYILYRDRSWRWWS